MAFISTQIHLEIRLFTTLFSVIYDKLNSVYNVNKNTLCKQSSHCFTASKAYNYLLSIWIRKKNQDITDLNRTY